MQKRTYTGSEHEQAHQRISPPGRSFSAVRATADGGAELAGDPKINIFTE